MRFGASLLVVSRGHRPWSQYRVECTVLPRVRARDGPTATLLTGAGTGLRSHAHSHSYTRSDPSGWTLTARPLFPSASLPLLPRCLLSSSCSIPPSVARCCVWACCSISVRMRRSMCGSQDYARSQVRTHTQTETSTRQRGRGQPGLHVTTAVGSCGCREAGQLGQRHRNS